MGREEPGRLVAARYRLQTVMREDDMGAVWLANDGLRHGDVVLRAIPWVPPSDDEEQGSRRERLFDEARALARLDHPNIVRILNVAEDDGRPWMVFQATPYRFPHRSLSDVVCKDGPLWPEQAAEVGLQVLAAVRQAHAVGVLHRDLKPSSILLGPGHQVLLTDFGMVTADGSNALTTPAALTGSPFYMAPERASGAPATPAADLWSLGAALYAAVEGRVPFDRHGTVAVVSAVVNASPSPPRLAGPLWPVISGLLRKDPAARPDADAVDWLLRRVTGEAGPPPLAPAAIFVPVAARAVPPARAIPRKAAGAVPRPTVAAAPEPTVVAAPEPTVVAQPEPQTAVADTGNAESEADFIPGFGPRDPAPTAAKPHVRKPRRQRSSTTGEAR